jgi:hypothetical protein
MLPHEANQKKCAQLDGHYREGQIKKAMRRMHVYNPIPSQFGEWPDGERARNITTDRIIEDPIFRVSGHSYFVQLADCVAYALLKREVPPTERVTKYGIDKMFESILGHKCFRKACRKNPLGIVRA